VNKVAEEEDELEGLRKRRLVALQQKVADEQRQAQMEQQTELQKQALLKKILAPEARQRLTNLRMVRPEFTDQLELQLIQLAQQGKLPIPLTDVQLKQILAQLQTQKRETKIRRV
jgi:programmed cell death protein 5